jgi:hypothetical protein
VLPPRNSYREDPVDFAAFLNDPTSNHLNKKVRLPVTLASRLNAQPAPQGSSISAVSASSHPGVLLTAQNQQAPEAGKHSCKGKNDCKGQGGGKDAGKNDCKGKGGCATDGSTPPSAS